MLNRAFLKCKLQWRSRPRVVFKYWHGISLSLRTEEDDFERIDNCLEALRQKLDIYPDLHLTFLLQLVQNIFWNIRDPFDVG